MDVVSRFTLLLYKTSIPARIVCNQRGGGGGGEPGGGGGIGVEGFCMAAGFSYENRPETGTLWPLAYMHCT